MEICTTNDIVVPRSAGVRVWEWQAACLGVDTEIFFGPASRSHEWKTVCGSCPVTEICFWSAMAAEGTARAAERFGIYGKTTPAQRARIAGVVDAAVTGKRLADAVAGWANGLVVEAGGDDVVEEADGVVVEEADDGGVPVPATYLGLPDARGRRCAAWAVKNPEPGKRRCSTCDLVLPIKQFDVNDRRRGYRHSSCRGCKREYNKDRQRQAASEQRAQRQPAVA